jgi:hypothetical protein
VRASGGSSCCRSAERFHFISRIELGRDEAETIGDHFMMLQRPGSQVLHVAAITGKDSLKLEELRDQDMS